MRASSRVLLPSKHHRTECTDTQRGTSSHTYTRNATKPPFIHRRAGRHPTPPKAVRKLSPPPQTPSLVPARPDHRRPSHLLPHRRTLTRGTTKANSLRAPDSDPCSRLHTGYEGYPWHNGRLKGRGTGGRAPRDPASPARLLIASWFGSGEDHAALARSPVRSFVRCMVVVVCVP